MHLITGHSGFAHITSANDGAVNAHVFGEGSYVFDTRDRFEANIINSNEIRIGSGEGLHNGRYFEIANLTYETANIDNGSLGTNRIDLIVARYSKDGETDIETMQLVVIKGNPAQNPVAPAFNSASVLDGASVSDYPLYKVTIEGITLKSVTPLFTIRKDIVNDVLINNAETVAQIAEDNQQTVEAVQTSNVSTKEAIEQSNAETKAEIKADNASTLAGVQASNAETLAAVQAKVETVLTAEVLWENSNPDNVPEGIKVNHNSIAGYRYVEYIYSVFSPYFDKIATVNPHPRAFMSSGKLPVYNGNCASTILRYLNVNEIGSEYAQEVYMRVQSVGKATYFSNNGEFHVSAYDDKLPVITDEEGNSYVENIAGGSQWDAQNGIILASIIGYK